MEKKRPAHVLSWIQPKDSTDPRLGFRPKQGTGLVQGKLALDYARRKQQRRCSRLDQAPTESLTALTALLASAKEFERLSVPDARVYFALFSFSDGSAKCATFMGTRGQACGRNRALRARRLCDLSSRRYRGRGDETKGIVLVRVAGDSLAERQASHKLRLCGKSIRSKIRECINASAGFQGGM